MNQRRTPSRTANVLVATLIVLAGVGSIVALSSDRLVGTRALQSANLAKQQASYAAEAMASLVETKLVVSSSDLNNLTSDVVETDAAGNKTIGQRWLAQGLYHNGSLTTKGMWLGNCLVYWRIEPVKIYSKTINDKNGDGILQGSTEIPSDGVYSDNYQANPNEVVTPNATFTGKAKNGDNPGYYHFRIVTQAYFVNQAEWGKQNLTMNTVNPWERPEHTISSAQAQRLVQLKLVNLFRYVLFYGAKKETGDIELNPGANLDIVGAVHSNGAIYLGGQGTGYLDGNYKYAATSTANITVGSADNQVTVTGVDGIFRTRKVGNYHYQDKYNPTPSVQDPYQIDVADNNLNGPIDSRVKLNNVDLTPKNDSRSGLSGHTAKVRDRNLGAGEVNTLANIPQLSGYPFEPQAVVGQGVPLFRTANGTGGFTIRPGDFDLATTKQLYYNDSFTGITTTAKAGQEVYATDLPLISYQRGSNLVNDVMFTNQPVAKADFNDVEPSTLNLFGDPDAVSTQRKHTFLLHTEEQKSAQDSGFEARGYYLQMSLFGQPSSNRTGLTIRERGAQNTAWTMFDKMGAKITGRADRPTRSVYTSSEADYVKAMSQYMARNYVVYFGLENGVPVDVTAFFFGLEKNVSGDMVGTYETESQLPAIEGGFVNRREANSYRIMGYLTDASTYKNDVLSLNIGRIQQLIKDNKYIKFNPSTTLDDDTPSSVIFNGLIYAHRTPRLGKTDKDTPIFDPRAPLRYHPLVSTKDDTATGIYGFTGGLYPMIGSVKEGKMNTSSSILYRNGDPLVSIWSVFPSLKQVRVFNGSEINWGATQKSGRLQGLTVVTPNHCYVQGDYNTKVDPVKTAKGANQYPPCGIYADGMTMLTNLWKDVNGAHDKTPGGNTTTYNVSVVTNNIPTDYENAWDEGSGGTHNLLRFLENGGRDFNFFGSIVVLNRMRYARNYLGAKAGWYGAPNRVLKFNQDLLTAEGQPPFSPWGMQVTRVLSSVNTTNR